MSRRIKEEDPGPVRYMLDRIAVQNQHCCDDELERILTAKAYMSSLGVARVLRAAYRERVPNAPVFEWENE